VSWRAPALRGVCPLRKRSSSFSLGEKKKRRAEGPDQSPHCRKSQLKGPLIPCSPKITKEERRSIPVYGKRKKEYEIFRRREGNMGPHGDPPMMKKKKENGENALLGKTLGGYLCSGGGEKGTGRPNQRRGGRKKKSI